MDIAPYINDARNGQLMLLGGVTGREADYGYHDWEFFLNEIGLLRYDHSLARIGYDLGVLLMLISFAWAGYLLFKQYKNLDLAKTALLNQQPHDAIRRNSEGCQVIAKKAKFF
jgi:hypothetical protein